MKEERRKRKLVSTFTAGVGAIANIGSHIGFGKQATQHAHTPVEEKKEALLLPKPNGD